MKKKLEAGKQSAFQSYDLCTIRCDAPLDFVPEQALRRPANRGLLRELFLRLGFQKLMEQMGLDQEEAVQGSQAAVRQAETVEQVTEEARWRDLLAQWRGQTVAVLTLPDLSALVVCWDQGEQAALFREETLPTYGSFLREFFCPEIVKLGYHIKDVMSRGLDRGWQAQGFVFDGAIAAYLLAPTDGSYELDKLGAQYFQKTLPPAKEYLGAKVWKDAAGAQAAGQVMASHAALLFALYALLPEKLAAFGLTKVYEDIELPLCPVLAEMEQAGMLVDEQALAQFGAGLTAGIAALQEEIWAQAGEEFNLNSTQQLGRVLFEQLG